MMDGMGDDMGGVGWAMMIVLWVVLLGLVIWAVSSLFPSTSRSGRAEGAAEILDRRLAAGEIDRATFDGLRSALDRGRTDSDTSARRTPVMLAILLAAALLLAVSVIWVVARADEDGPWSMHHYGAGMMGYAAAPGAGAPVEDLAGARRQAARFADRLDLEVGELMQFTNGYYAELEEPDGTPATEVLVDPGSGAVWLEFGPAMMWNSRYGMMSDFRRRDAASGMMDGAGMMGEGMMDRAEGVPGLDPTWPGPGNDTDGVTADDALQTATRWLAARDPALSAADATAFPGYYTLHIMRDGKAVGMLSVNADTGSVWYHWWHGRFVTMAE